MRDTGNGVPLWTGVKNWVQEDATGSLRAYRSQLIPERHPCPYSELAPGFWLPALYPQYLTRWNMMGFYSRAIIFILVFLISCKTLDLAINALEHMSHTAVCRYVSFWKVLRRQEEFEPLAFTCKYYKVQGRTFGYGRLWGVTLALWEFTIIALYRSRFCLPTQVMCRSGCGGVPAQGI